jgi:hypothetical protein
MLAVDRMEYGGGSMRECLVQNEVTLRSTTILLSAVNRIGYGSEPMR